MKGCESASCSSRQAGWLRIRVSRQNWPSSPVHVQIGAIRTQYRQPALGKVYRDRRYVARRLVTKVIWLRTPPTPFGARVVIDKKFIPRDVDPRIGDPRILGAQVDYRFFKKLPRGVKPQPTG